MTSDPFEVTTAVPEKVATTHNNEALATQGAQTSETTTTETNVELRTADKTATETTDETDAETLEQTDTEESDTEDEVETKNESKDPKPKKKNGFQRRVNKLNQEIEYWRTEAIKNQKVAAPSKEEKSESKPLVQAMGKPDKDKFETHDEYIEALAEWKADQKFKTIQEENRQNSAIEAALKKQNEHFARVETFKDDHEDFDDVWAGLKVPLTLAMSETIKESDLGPDLMYALAKDPKECARIAKLTPLAAARELGKLEVKVSKSQNSDSESLVEVKPKTIVKESVVNPVKARGASVKKDIYDPELPLEDFIKLRNAEERARHAR